MILEENEDLIPEGWKNEVGAPTLRAMAVKTQQVNLNDPPMLGQGNEGE